MDSGRQGGRGAKGRSAWSGVRLAFSGRQRSMVTFSNSQSSGSSACGVVLTWFGTILRQAALLPVAKQVPLFGNFPRKHLRFRFLERIGAFHREMYEH